MTEPEEVERRLRRVSQLRGFILELRHSAREAHRAGRVHLDLGPPVRSDAAYWARLARQKGIQLTEDEAQAAED
jgi:hypothetical protein